MKPHHNLQNFTFVLYLHILSIGFARLSHLALLSGTLKKFDTNACDGDTLNVKCPNGTLISIVGASYSKSTSPDFLCLPRNEEESKYLNEGQDVTCNSSQAFITVVNSCQEKQACKMVASPRTFGGDPCPGIRKLATIEHRCRPRFFKRKVICQGQAIKLKCPRGKRLAIFSAEFGRSQKHKVLECPLPPDMASKPIKYCQASFATETVLKLCHGERRCVIDASTDTFGNPCQQNVNMYLRVEFTCVPKEILKEEFRDTSDVDSGGDILLTNFGIPKDDKLAKAATDIPDWPKQPPRPPSIDHSDSRDRSNPYMVPSNDTNRMQQSDETTGEEDCGSTSNCTDQVIISNNDPDPRVVGFVTEWISAYSFIKDNKEKFILYLTLSIAAGILLLLIVLSLRLYSQKKKRIKHAKLNISQPVPSMFADNSSELEHFGSECTDHTDQVEVVRYTNRSTMRRQDSDTNPRAPVSMSLNNYYYS